MINYHTAKSGDLDLHYAEVPGSGPVLVFLHGITGSSASFEPILTALAHTAHMYALDLRGHGLSDRADAPNGYRVPDFSRDVQAFLEQVVGEPAVLVGHSLGGLVAAWTAAHRATEIRGVLLEDPPLYTSLSPVFEETIFFDFFVYLRQLLHQHGASGGSVEDLAKEVAAWPVAEGVTMLDQVGEEGVRARALELHRLDGAVLDAVLEGLTWGASGPDQILTQIKCPVHLVAGQYDLGGALTSEDVERAVASVPHCTHTVFGDLGHGIHSDQPDVFLQELRRFLSTLS